MLVDQNVLVQLVEEEETEVRHILEHVLVESVERDVYMMYAIFE